MAKKFFVWQKGRQNSGYDKMLLAEWFNPLVPFDVYLIKYSIGSKIDSHKDLVAGYRHVRINLVLKEAQEGGRFESEAPIFKSRRLNIFYSDRPHWVGEITQGNRLLLSIGMLFKDNKL